MTKKTITISVIILIFAITAGSFWFVKNQNNVLNPAHRLEGLFQDLTKQLQKSQKAVEQQVVKQNQKTEQNDKVILENMQDVENVNESENNNLNVEDRKKIFKAFTEYLKMNDRVAFGLYKGKELHISSIQLKKKGENKYLSAIIWTEGQHSAPNILAVKCKDDWEVVFRGQDYPNCSILQKYDFPKNIRGIEKCFDKNGNLSERS